MTLEGGNINGYVLVFGFKRFQMSFKMEIYGTIVAPFIFQLWIHVVIELLQSRSILDLLVMCLYMFWWCLRMIWKVGSIESERNWAFLMKNRAGSAPQASPVDWSLDQSTVLVILTFCPLQSTVSYTDQSTAQSFSRLNQAFSRLNCPGQLHWLSAMHGLCTTC